MRLLPSLLFPSSFSFSIHTSFLLFKRFQTRRSLAFLFQTPFLLCNSSPSSSSCFMASSFKGNQRLGLPPRKPHLSAQLLPGDTQQNQSKFSGFLLKGAFVIIVIVVLPFYPSQAPEFINHTILNRGWEFLRLGIIGVALPYGILSRRRAETEKEIQAQIYSTQSYVSKILQVSPVFDSENDMAPYLQLFQ